MTPAPFHHVLRTRFNEIDIQGRVFNAHWMTYFDEAFSEFISSLGESIMSELIHSVLVKSEIEWKGSAGYRDEIVIVVSVARIGNTSFDVVLQAAVGSETVCTATNTYVNVDPATGKSRLE